ncbi:hypothetical protein GCM10022289_05130 [Pedobacter jeongneungensis]|uniref:Uncharacterized protein n=1 Tax=Pedobacter jeongneungensis TaxID=947309 RepID=A0ABP8B4P1_9SPHI
MRCSEISKTTRHPGNIRQPIALTGQKALSLESLVVSPKSDDVKTIEQFNNTINQLTDLND